MPRTSSSRPTPGRGYQTMPAGMAAPVEPQQDDVPEWASGGFTLYISYLHAHVPEKMLFSVMRQTGIGMMRRAGAIELAKHEPRGDEKYPYQSAKIHFDFLFTRGQDRDQNLRVLDHLLHGGDDAHFQVVYQAARRNPKNGKDEPDRFWKVKAWREGMRSVSPSSAPAIKISLHGGAVGPKDVAASDKKPSAIELARAAARRAAKEKRASADADGFITPKTHGAPAAMSSDIDGHDGGQSVGGGFAALAVSPSGSSSGTDSSSTSPNPMTKSAKKNAKRRAAKQRKAEAARAEQADGGAAAEVAKVIAQHATPMTQAEMDECDAAIAADEAARQPTPSNDDIAGSAAEFIVENQIREEGAENAGAWEMDASTGAMLYHDEMTAAAAASLVPAAAVLDVDALQEAIDIAENGAPTAKRAAGGVSSE